MLQIQPEATTFRRFARLSVLLVLMPWMIATGCSDRTASESTASSRADAPLIVATTAMIGDVAWRIAGDTARVEVLIGSGVDPHQFRATRSHTALIARADLVIANGLRLEAKLLDTLQRGTGDQSVLMLGEEIDPGLLLRDEQTNEPDPHLWMDPVRWSEIVPLIESRLIEIMPEHGDTIRQNAADYRSELEELHRYAAQVLDSIPPSQRLLVTAHDAFGYLADRYDIEVEGIQGLSTDSEAGLQRVQELVDRLVSQGVSAVFVESSVSDRNVRNLIQGAEAQNHRVTIGGELFSDAMGEAGTYEGSYIGMIDHNVTVIARSLGGAAPAAGMRGTLSIAATNGSTP